MIQNEFIQEEKEKTIDETKIPPVILRHKVPTIPFWATDPNVLFQPATIFEFFPIESMSYNQKLNAVTRAVIIMTLFGFFFTRSFHLVIVSAVTIGAIFAMHHYHEKEQSKKTLAKEGFSNSPAVDYLVTNKYSVNTDGIFSPPTSKNPFSNVLMTDYESNPNKNPAEPSADPNTQKQVLTSVKQMIDEANPNHPGLSDRLFQDLGDELVFEQSMRQFHSNPATTIPNDQGAFADFCYGSMISCKEGNLFACARNTSHYTNH